RTSPALTQIAPSRRGYFDDLTFCYIFISGHKKEAEKVKGCIRFATARPSFAKSPELAYCVSSDSVPFFTLSFGRSALRPSPEAREPYEVAGAFQGWIGRGREINGFSFICSAVPPSKIDFYPVLLSGTKR
ncbi:MAG: hypothetical protein LIP00_03865, partial [Parabacteroides sp.]|nr:hypothetical protein [Parabacteroides sp.]